METKNKIILSAVAIAVAFAFGRYTTPVKIVTEVKTVEVEKKTVEKDKHTETTTVETTKPDGTKEVRTHTITDTSITKKEVDTRRTDNTTTSTRGGSATAISGLSGVDFTQTPKIIYGAHVTKQVLGPISIGIWGLTNSTAGASIGLSF